VKGKEGCPQLVKESFPESEGEAPIRRTDSDPIFLETCQVNVVAEWRGFGRGCAFSPSGLRSVQSSKAFRCRISLLPCQERSLLAFRLFFAIMVSSRSRTLLKTPDDCLKKPARYRRGDTEEVISRPSAASQMKSAG